MNTARYIIFFFLILTLSKSVAQDKYWVFFKARDLEVNPPVSSKTLENRKNLGLPIRQITDFGPKAVEIESLGVVVANKSRWFNAVSAYLTINDINRLKTFESISEIRKITDYQSFAFWRNYPKQNDVFLTYPLHQINAGVFIDKEWLGAGVDIGVIDGGFFEANSDLNLAHLFQNKQVMATKDFFSPPKIDFFGEKKSNGEVHGTMVTTAIGGLNAEKRQIYGLGIRSNYSMARTESSQRESRIEEDNWIAAIEWLDSLGVRLANSSLGYSSGFSNPAESYRPQDMDGKTSLISKGARMAVNEKGMILVVSAGNEGENKVWGGIVSTPGDVEEVISVGANDDKGMRMAYSSKGVEDVPFIKPDVTVYSDNGTSLAAPVVTGLIAGMLQKKPYLLPKEVKEMLHNSSSLALSPNNYMGYGIPNSQRLADRLEEKVYRPENIDKQKAKKSINIKTLQKEAVVVFHKKDNRNVVSQTAEFPLDGNILIVKPQDVKRTTVVLKDKIVEIFWKN